MKLRLPRIITKALSVRLSLMVVIAMAMLLMASLVVMLYYSRKAVKEEALQKAVQTLNGTVQHIDNILLSVEQASGNVYFNLLPFLHDSEKRDFFTQQLVCSNPYIVDCVIALKDDSAFVGQPWFDTTMKSGTPRWQDPSKSNDSNQSVIKFCLPFYDTNGKPAGVMATDVSLGLLSQIVLENKPSPNSYCTLLAGDGTLIVYPDSSNLFQHTVFSINKDADDPSVMEAARAMLSGETGYKPFHKNGNDYYVFYKPFKRTAMTGRSMEKLDWSAGIIYPEDDIFGDYNSLLYYVLAIAFAGLLMMFILSRYVIQRQLKPLLMLTASAQRIAQGHFYDSIPDSHQEDEIGRLQDNFQQMQQSLANHIGELEQLTAILHERGDSLRTAYNAAQKADRMKTAFLHNMTNQMLSPAEAIDNDVKAMSHSTATNGQSTNANKQLAEDILKNGTVITELLKNLLNMSDEEMRKEESHG